MSGPLDITIEDVLIRVRKIGTLDDEAAHSEEDSLFADVLRAVAAGHPSSAELAEAALESLKLDFERWCA